MSLSSNHLFVRNLRNVLFISIRNRTKLKRQAYPPRVTLNLEQRLSALDTKDPILDAPVDIGYPTAIRQKAAALRERSKSEKDNEALLKAAFSKTLKIDLHKVKESWQYNGLLEEVREVAKHYGIFNDLFHHGFFTPRVPLHVAYDFSDSDLTPVHRGNVLTASEASSKPHVSYDSGPDDLWTLVLTNPDGHFSDNNSEYLHWFICNIKGNDLSSGNELVPYLQPFPPKGTGYHRMVFILYKQDAGVINYKTPNAVSHKYKLKERNFRTFDFYKENQDSITPAGLAFFQATWDETLRDFFLNVLEMREPVFKYIQKPKYIAPQVKYPFNLPFNNYLDRYRDRQEMRKEVLLKRLKMIHPFVEEPPMPKFPNLHIKMEPSWAIADRWRENNRLGRYKDLGPFSIHEQREFDFKRDMLNRSLEDEIPHKS